jgi:hypothetical protein
MTAMRNVASAVGGGLAVPAIPYVWLVGASNIYCMGIGRPDLFVFPFTQWLQVAPYWRLNWWMTLWVIVAAAAPTIVLGLAAIIMARRCMRPAPQVYGATKWASRGEMNGGNISTDRTPF